MRPWKLVAVLALSFASIGAHAKIRRLLDIDGTVVNDHGPKAAWKTYWILKRVERVHSAIQPNPERATRGVDAPEDSPPFIELSYAEYRKFLPFLAKGEAMLGDLGVQELDADPLRTDRPTHFIPGLYRISSDISFKRHRNGYGTNYLLSDYRDAIRRWESSKGKLQWVGPAFPLLQAGLSDPSEVDSVVFFTARDHTDAELREWLEAMKADNWIAHTQGEGRRGQLIQPRVHFLHDPDSILFGHHLTEKKAKVVVTEATQLLNAPFPMHTELVTDQYQAALGKTQQMHTLIVAEDDPRYVAQITKVLERLSAELHLGQRVKFVLLNSGVDESLTPFEKKQAQGVPADEISRSPWPYRWTVFDKGFGRPALPEEVALWTNSKSEEQCSRIIIGDPQVGRLRRKS